ncbi:MAG: PAS domain-containing protein [Anaerolineae bacterium]|nr:PAS domain-containing protein [Anaerolineae bacterium]
MNPTIKYQMMVISTIPNLATQLQVDIPEYDFAQYDSIEAGMTACESNFPHVLLFDDDLDGKSLLRQINAIPSGDKIPIVVMVNDETDATINRITGMGFFDYVLKPVRSSIIGYRIRQILVLNQIYQMQQALRQSEERHRIISNTISDYAYSYLVLEDGTLKKEWSTQAFHDITGYTFQEMDSDGWEKLIYPDDIPLALARYERLMRGERDVTEFRITTKSGEIRWLRDHGYPIVDENGKVTHIYGAAQDITQRKEAEDMLRHQAEELRIRNEELDAFAYTVAHDLKNPIASMMGFASLMQTYYDKMDKEKILEYLSLITESGYKLKDIINALLLLAGVSKETQPDIMPLDMKIIVDDSKRRLMQLIQETQADISYPDDFPLAQGYAPWVEEIWANYLSNALKYGGRPAKITIGADEPQNGMVRFWIRDNGRGLTSDEQERVFTPFTRLNQVKIEGHGLGLSIVQRIAHRLGGDVAVSSVVGQGCEFSFTLPEWDGRI